MTGMSLKAARTAGAGSLRSLRGLGAMATSRNQKKSPFFSEELKKARDEFFAAVEALKHV